MKKHVTPQEATEYYGVNISTLRQWDMVIKSGRKLNKRTARNMLT